MKKYIAFIVLFILTLLVFFAVINNNQVIVQGEIETKTVDLSSKITGRVKEIKVQKGDTVKKATY